MLQACFETLTCSNRYFLGNHSPSDHSQSCTQTVSQCATNSNPKRILRKVEKQSLLTLYMKINSASVWWTASIWLLKDTQSICSASGPPRFQNTGGYSSLWWAVSWTDSIMKQIIHGSRLFNSRFQLVWVLMLRQAEQDSSLWDRPLHVRSCGLETFAYMWVAAIMQTLIKGWVTHDTITKISTHTASGQHEG